MQNDRFWSDEEIQVLIDKYEHTPVSVLSEEIDRSESGIRQKANSLGLTTDQNLQRRWELMNSDLEPPEMSDEEMSFICGLIVGEGTFAVVDEGKGRKTFKLSIQLKEDRQLLENVKDIIGCGAVYEVNGGEYSSYSSGGADNAWNVIVPIFDSASFMGARKEEQYEEWKEELKDYYDLEKQR